eukprot:scaffold50488_cov270-Isochrysis_galbana.AAC.2
MTGTRSLPRSEQWKARSHKTSSHDSKSVYHRSPSSSSVRGRGWRHHRPRAQQLRGGRVGTEGSPPVAARAVSGARGAGALAVAAPGPLSRSTTMPKESADRCGECGMSGGSRKISPAPTRTSRRRPRSMIGSCSSPSCCQKNSAPRSMWKSVREFGPPTPMMDRLPLCSSLLHTGGTNADALAARHFGSTARAAKRAAIQVAAARPKIERS